MHFNHAGMVALPVARSTPHRARPKQGLMREWAGATSGTDRVKTRAQCGALLLQLRQPTRAHCKTLTFLHAVCHQHVYKFLPAPCNKFTLEFHVMSSEGNQVYVPGSYCNAAAMPEAKKMILKVE